VRTEAGYQWLADQYELCRIDDWALCLIDTACRNRQKKDLGTHKIQLFPSRYRPNDTLPDQLQFALRYEGLNLQLLALLYEKIDPTALCIWLEENPTSAYARRACYLYEWIMDDLLPIKDPVPTKAGYVAAIDGNLQFALGDGDRHARFRVINNLPGTREFCPLVRRTDYLDDMIQQDLRHQTRASLERYDQRLLTRAAAFLYLKETQSSFEVEREKPTVDKAQRFADMLAQVDASEPLSEARIVDLQNAVIDPRFHEFTWRQQQNWVGKDLDYRKQIDFVPARPEHLKSLMQGLLATAAKARSINQSIESKASDTQLFDPVIYAAIIAFGFVFINPFMDGNGRIHRYLIHEVLANAGFTPRGIVLPVSAVILTKLDEYVYVLEHFSKPLRAITEYNPDLMDVPAKGNEAVYFRYFDATVQAEFLYKALKHTVEVDLQDGINFLMGFDSACLRLNQQLDWPDHSMELFIRVVQQNKGSLAKAKRDSHFGWMTQAEITEAETRVKTAFGMLDN
jgi:hypothetical protein